MAPRSRSKMLRKLASESPSQSAPPSSLLPPSPGHLWRLHGRCAAKSSIEDEDLAVDATRALDPTVGRHQHRVQRLGQGDVGGVVGTEVVAQLPYAREQRQVRDAPQGKCAEISKRLRRATFIE